MSKTDLSRTMSALLPFSLSAALTLFLGACGTPTDPALRGSIAAAGGDPDKLLIVDCLLPGQVRKLGTSVTYITARRPIKTTISLCELRGGEYVAYDRADLSTALRFWLPSAEAGDPEAQTNIGEIYQRGLGVVPNYAKAAQWYRKAAGQGNERAQISLGHLYERGLGVRKDKVTAINWYRRASGLTDDELAFTSSIRQLQVQSVASSQAVAAAQREAEQLRAEIRRLQKQLNQQGKQEQNTRRELEKARQKLLQQPPPRSVAVATPPQRSADAAQVRRLKTQLTQQIRQQSRLTKEAELLKSRLVAETRGTSALRGQLSGLEKQLAVLKSEKQQLAASSETLKRQQNVNLTEVRNDLQAVQVALKQQNQLLAKQESSEIQQLREDLNSSSQRISELQQSLSENRDRVDEQTDLEIQRASLAKARQQLEQTRGQLDRQRAVLATEQSEEADELNEQLRQQTEELKRKEGQIQVLEQQLSSSNEKLAVTEGEIEALEKETQQVKQTLTQRGVGGVAGVTGQAAESKPSFADLKFGRYYALLIGNDNYANFPDLQTAASDARAVANMLKTRYGFQSQLLVNANRYQILSALNKFREQLTEKDNFLLYYAGHGELDRSNTRGHWLPVDAEPDSTANSISNTAITDILNAMAAKHVMVIADSCYSGSLTRSVATSLGGGMPPDLHEKWLRKMITLRSRTVLTSGGLQPVLDVGGGNHSIFAKEFLRALRNNEKVLEGPVLYSGVARRVKVAAGKLGFDQTPQYGPISFAGDMLAPFFFRPVTL